MNVERGKEKNLFFSPFKLKFFQLQDSEMELAVNGVKPQKERLEK